VDCSKFNSILLKDVRRLKDKIKISWVNFKEQPKIATRMGIKAEELPALRYFI